MSCALLHISFYISYNLLHLNYFSNTIFLIRLVHHAYELVHFMNLPMCIIVIGECLTKLTTT